MSYTDERTSSDSDYAVHHDIIVKKGDSFERQFRYWEVDDDGNKVAKDITDSDYRMDIARGKDQKELFTLTVGDGITKVDSQTIKVKILAVVMWIGAGTFTYAIRETLAGGDPTVTIQEGPFVIRDNISPPPGV